MRKLFSVFKSKLKTAVLYSSCLAENTYNRTAYWVHSCSRPRVAGYRADAMECTVGGWCSPQVSFWSRNPFYAESLPLLTKEGKATPSGWATVHHAEQTLLLRPGICRSLELAGDLTSTTQSTASELRWFTFRSKRFDSSWNWGEEKAEEKGKWSPLRVVTSPQVVVTSGSR